MNQSPPDQQARDYAGLLLRFGPGTLLCPGPDLASMERFVDACWEVLSPCGISWIGFYLKDPATDQLILGPRRDKPACSPIGLHGMCGRSFLERRPIVVRDVASLGPDYIACDPLDRSEVVIPLLHEPGSCWGVLDADSYSLSAFSAADVAGLTAVVEAAGLSHAPPARPEPVYL